jgi:glycine betaine/proline transport system ATP-binding protein
MQGGVVVQVGTPDEILNNPANDYVCSFFKGVDISHVFSAGDIARRTQVTIITKGTNEGLRSGLQRLKDYDRDFGYVIDKDNKFVGVVSADSLYNVIHQNQTLSQAMLSDIDPVAKDTPIHEIIGIVAQAPCAVPVVSEEHKYLGCISKALLLETLDREA